jgi:hypothetical protein
MLRLQRGADQTIDRPCARNSGHAMVETPTSVKTLSAAYDIAHRDIPMAKMPIISAAPCVQEDTASDPIHERARTLI